MYLCGVTFLALKRTLLSQNFIFLMNCGVFFVCFWVWFFFLVCLIFKDVQALVKLLGWMQEWLFINKAL